MKTFLTITVLSLLFISNIQGQNITNGTFDNRASGWGCNPEAVHVASTYGGPNNDRVAEIDAAAGLCQTISGFTIGTTYDLVFDCSRRTTCGPTVQSMNITIDNGSFSENVSRNGTPFQFEEEVFSFTATATSHTITFAGTSTGTCGLILDNIALRSSLPIELVYFKATPTNNKQVVQLQWQTLTETNNSHFSLERSQDGMNWKNIQTIAGAGNSAQTLNYRTEDLNPLEGDSYYRLKQTDFDGQFSYSNLRAVHIEPAKGTNIQIFPNPTSATITVKGLPATNNIQLFNALGQEVHVSIISSAALKTVLDLSHLETGVYYLKTPTSIQRIQKQ